MVLDESATVAEFVAELPETKRVLERLGIDSCCGGQRPLAEACAAVGLNIRDVLSELRSVGSAKASKATSVDWRAQPVAELAKYIVASHHAYLNTELPELETLIDKVHKVHGANHPELDRLHQLFQNLKQDLEPHMFKEEQILFPHIIQLDEARRDGRTAPPSCFGTVENPIRVMLDEHDAVAELLKEMRAVSSEYALPADACNSFRNLYERLPALEHDLHQHIHLENDILFPGARALEKQPSHGRAVPNLAGES